MQSNAHVISECKSYPFLQIFSSDSNSQVVSLFLSNESVSSSPSKLAYIFSFSSLCSA